MEMINNGRTRTEILSQEVLCNKDIQELLGVGQTTASSIFSCIKKSKDRLGLAGKVHIQDYYDYFNIPMECRVGVVYRIGSPGEIVQPPIIKHIY